MNDETDAKWEAEVLHQGNPGIIMRHALAHQYRFVSVELEPGDPTDVKRFANFDLERKTVTLCGITYMLSLFETFGTDSIGSVVKIMNRVTEEHGGVVMLQSFNEPYDMQDAIDRAASALRLHGKIELATLGAAIRDAYWHGVSEHSELTKEQDDVDTDSADGGEP